LCSWVVLSQMLSPPFPNLRTPLPVGSKGLASAKNAGSESSSAPPPNNTPSSWCTSSTENSAPPVFLSFLRYHQTSGDTGQDRLIFYHTPIFFTPPPPPFFPPPPCATHPQVRVPPNPFPWLPLNPPWRFVRTYYFFETQGPPPAVLAEPVFLDTRPSLSKTCDVAVHRP